MGDIDPRRARDLGMDRLISRRDFFDGVAVTAGAAAVGAVTGIPLLRGGHGGGGPERPAEIPYPPALTGLRGDDPDALSVPHALRDGRFWEHAGAPHPTGEAYDLVVVGGGVSGVAAAHEWLRRDPGARVLILDNHDEIGGHARRNEFRGGGRPGPLIGPGGSPSLGSPEAWTPEGKELLALLGVEPDTLAGYTDRTLYPGLGLRRGVMCDKETFGHDRLVRFEAGVQAEEWVSRLPIDERARQDLVMLYTDPPDWLAGLSREEKEGRLAELTYSAFLLEVCGVHPDVERFCRTMPSARWGYGADSFGAIDAWGTARHWDYPGFQGLGLGRGKPSRFNSPTVRKEWDAGAPLRFPEGNQALVRMLVGRMIPGFAGSTSADGVTAASYDYDRLDRPGNRVRFRLSSPVVSVRNDGDPRGADPEAASTATVGYFDGYRLRTVSAGAVVLACWHTVIPYLVPELPEDQLRALRAAVKTPVLHATVRLRDWRAWHAAGLRAVRWTGAYWCQTELGRPVSTPGYQSPRDPSEPILAHLVAAPCRSELGPVRGAAAGRQALLKTSYEHLEFTVRDQLTRLLEPHGFDPAADIEAVTVNRWGHGYAPEYRRPWHDFYPDGPFPAEAARRPFGRIAIANADAVPGAGFDAAVTAAHRAVSELSR
ncbi:NAD(P)-binding protein [Nonomuraea sp. NPDC050383]|uniref:NAD(P)-binding protein n=1 Tax=Nonomuraea sp. NPDC050383 TaxID=3364362 RepID=UPI0037B6C7A8